MAFLAGPVLLKWEDIPAGVFCLLAFCSFLHTQVNKNVRLPTNSFDERKINSGATRNDKKVIRILKKDNL